MGHDEPANAVYQAHEISKDAACAIAKCLIATQDAPAAKVQIVMAQEDPPEDCWIERRELRSIIPRALERCDALFQASTDPQQTIVWKQLRDMLAKRPSKT